MRERLTFFLHHTASFTQGITYRSRLAVSIHYQHQIPTDNMGDRSEQQVEPLAATENNEDNQGSPNLPATPKTTALAPEPTKKKKAKRIFARRKKDKVDESAKTPTTPETVAERSKSGEAAAPAAGPDCTAEVDDGAPPDTASRPSSVVFDDIDLAIPSSSDLPPSIDGEAVDANATPSVPTIKLTPVTPQEQSVTSLVDDFLLQSPRSRNPPNSRRARGPKIEDEEDRITLKIAEEPGDYPHITGPRNLKHFGQLPYETRQVFIPLARHWIDHRPITKYAGEPLFKLSKACPYILVPRILAARLQLIVETPIILPDEVKELAAERELDVASLESYDIALLTILGALWDD